MNDYGMETPMEEEKVQDMGLTDI
jgi:ariadne-1